MTDDDYENWDLTVPLDPALNPPPREATREAIARDLTEAPAILTVDELADLLRVNRKTLYYALSRGEIPGARRIGATYRIYRDAVLTWLTSGQDRAARSRRNR